METVILILICHSDMSEKREYELIQFTYYSSTAKQKKKDNEKAIITYVI